MLTWIGYTLVAIGVFFALLGSIGLYRFPDFYTRAHAATKPDTLGLIATMLGLACLTVVGGPGVSGSGVDELSGGAPGVDLLTPLKLILIAVFVLVANPAAAHALGHAADRIGLEPWTRPRAAERSEPSS